MKYDVLIIGSGPAGLGAAFHLVENRPELTILIIEKNKISSGGLRNDCKQNYTFPIGFPVDIWSEKQAYKYLPIVQKHLMPDIKPKGNLEKYKKRASQSGVRLIEIEQSHVGTDRAVVLIHDLIERLNDLGVKISTEEEVKEVGLKSVCTNKRDIEYKQIILAPGRGGFSFLQHIMDTLEVPYIDNTLDIGIRVEMIADNYSIIEDYYDPKFLFEDKVRTFCTNSGAAYVVKERYDSYFSVNGHSLSNERKRNNLANFAMLKTIRLTDPVASGHEFAAILGLSAMQLGGGLPLMQRVGDFRMGKRSKKETFNLDLYNFKPTLNATPGDLALAIPAKILRDIWKSMKKLDTIVPGVLHPSTIMYYPEIKTYANKPQFIDNYFQAKDGVYLCGDGAGTSRGITAAWCSGIRCAEGILKEYGVEL